jgi:hypothetical protein
MKNPMFTSNSRFLQWDDLVRGKDIAAQIRGATATKRARVADALVGKTVINLSVEQARVLAHANANYVSALRAMTPSERAAVKAGHIRLADRCNRPREEGAP